MDNSTSFDALKGGWHLFRTSWKPMAAYTLLVWVATLCVLSPLVSWVMNRLVLQSGELFVSNSEMLNCLLLLSLMTIFLSSHPALGSYEPFAMMFSLNGVGIQWFILPLALIGSFFMSAFWCRFFCPCGHALTNLIQFRKKLIKIFKRK
jgi:hypothetical protein